MFVQPVISNMIYGFWPFGKNIQRQNICKLLLLESKLTNWLCNDTSNTNRKMTIEKTQLLVRRQAFKWSTAKTKERTR